MSERKIEDKLREEYFNLLPSVRQVKEQLEAEVKYDLIPILKGLEPHQRMDIVSRIKECQSAVDSLRSRQEGNLFDKRYQSKYSLKQLKDLAGIRILLFPRSLIHQVDKIIRQRYKTWEPDPVKGFNDEDEPLALKYYGNCSGGIDILGEIQIVPMLIGLFWEVEHEAIYKPKPEFKSVARSLEMRKRKQDVINALYKFEQEFEELTNKGRHNLSTNSKA